MVWGVLRKNPSLPPKRNASELRAVVVEPIAIWIAPKMVIIIFWYQ